MPKYNFDLIRVCSLKYNAIINEEDYKNININARTKICFKCSCGENFIKGLIYIFSIYHL